MDEYQILYEPGWDQHYEGFDPDTQKRITKKILQLTQSMKHRHLKHGLPYFVEESGGYRIVLEVNEAEKTKNIIFVGDHKQYEKWYKSV